MAQGSSGMERTWNIEAVINGFLADSSCTCMELPPNLSPGQRKQAKRIVEQHPDLVCETFGFGTERQLHLFKKTALVDPLPSNDVEVNTMMLPPGLALPFSDTPSRSDLASLASEDSKNLMGKTRSSSTDRSTTNPSTTTDSPASSCREVFSTPPGLRPPPGLDFPAIPFSTDGSVNDDRAVQSMPHSMFREALQREVAMKQAPLMPPSLQALDCPAAAFHLVPGTEVMIIGLQKSPAFNGHVGCVNDYDGETGRYNILLSPNGNTAGNKWAKVKPENLMPVSVPPPAREADESLISQGYHAAAPAAEGPSHQDILMKMHSWSVRRMMV